MVKKKVATRRPAANKGRKISVNMEGVSTDGFHVEPGEYPVKVAEVELRTSDNSGSDYLNFTCEITDGEEKGKKLIHTCSLQPQALFNLRRTLEAAGMEIPDSVVDIDLDELEGIEFGVSVEDDTYQGQTKSKIVNVFPLENIGGGEATETEEEQAELTYADVMKMKPAQLEDLCTEYEVKVKPGDKKDISKYRKAVAEGLGLEETEEPTEEGAEVTREDIMGMDKGQLDEICENMELEIDSKFKKVIAVYRKKVAAGLGLDE